ncbi:MAG TPA: nickel pincer cofactor biosynthesis protein LarC [Actinomycetota bacterium]
MTTIAYFDCFGGLAGDMLVGALLDAGAPIDALREVPTALGMREVTIEIDRVSRQGIAAAAVSVIPPPDADEAPGRPAGLLKEIVATSSLPPVVRHRSLEAVDRIATVEASIHGSAPDEVILHELGGVDTLIDICGTFVLLDALQVELVVCSPVPYGRGSTTTAHGPLPTPGPAVLGLLHGAPMVGVASSDELVTPTGAVLAAVAATSWGELPSMTLQGVGYGAGQRDPADRPNLLRVVLGTAPVADSERPVDRLAARADVVLLEANLDDLIPELIPDAVERCVAAGALDVWITPVTMKKGRPGVVVSAIARPEAERAVVSALFEHTSTLGVRVVPASRHELDRTTREVHVDGYAVRVKIGSLGGRVVNVAPEHDDCATVASLTGRPAKQIWAAALAAAEPVIMHEVEGTGHGSAG